MSVEEFKIKIKKKIILGFDFSKGHLNFHNSYIESSQFCKLLSYKKIYKGILMRKNLR